MHRRATAVLLKKKDPYDLDAAAPIFGRGAEAVLLSSEAEALLVLVVAVSLLIFASSLKCSKFQKYVKICQSSTQDCLFLITLLGRLLFCVLRSKESRFNFIHSVYGTILAPLKIVPITL